MFLMRDERRKEGRKKQARSKEQTRQSNTAHVSVPHMCEYISLTCIYLVGVLCLWWVVTLFKTHEIC